MVGPRRVPNCVKMTAYAYSLSDGTPSHLVRKTKDHIQEHNDFYAKKTTEFLQQMVFYKLLKMKSTTCSPDLNSIENARNIIKRRVYHNRRQFMSKDELCQVSKVVSSIIISEEIRKLTYSMNQRLLQLISRKGSSISSLSNLLKLFLLLFVANSNYLTVLVRFSMDIK